MTGTPSWTSGDCGCSAGCFKQTNKQKKASSKSICNFSQNLLEQELRALPLRCEASNGPHFDLNACVELLVPHVPHSLDRGGDCFILQNRSTAWFILQSGPPSPVCVLTLNPKAVQSPTLPPYRMEGACRTRPFTSVISSLTITPNSRT